MWIANQPLDCPKYRLFEAEKNPENAPVVCVPSNHYIDIM